MQIFCPLCLKDGIRQTIPIEHDDEAAICPSCDRRYSLLSRRITKVLSEKTYGSAYRYRFYTVEPGGAERVRVATAAANSGIRPGHLLTFVWRGRELVGIADQESSTWQSVVSERPLYPSLQGFFRSARWLLLVLLLVQVVRMTIELPEAIASYPLQIIIALIALAVFLLSPLLLWAVRTGGAKSQYLPGLDKNRKP